MFLFNFLDLIYGFLIKHILKGCFVYTKYMYAYCIKFKVLYNGKYIKYLCICIQHIYNYIAEY